MTIPAASAIWGLGRILADDFGYVGAHPGEIPQPAGVARDACGPPSVMTVQQFRSGKRLDCIVGTRENWQQNRVPERSRPQRCSRIPAA
ncbi:MAG UNVERIFIED_CONTAM: hypothetical protein LVR18_48470 [Planctomycetaceae bacterium]